MSAEKWSDREKKLANRVFEAALSAELAETLADFKAKASAANIAEDMWKIQKHLLKVQRDIDGKYDYRYSQLCFVFGRLVREGRINRAELEGLSAEKLELIERIAAA